VRLPAKPADPKKPSGSPAGTDLLWAWPFSPAQWQETPPAVRNYLLNLSAELAQLRGEVRRLQKTVEALTSRAQQDSQSSNRPPSSDTPFQKQRRKGKSDADKDDDQPKKPCGGQPGHPGHGPKLLEPTEPPLKVHPESCKRCASKHFRDPVVVEIRQQVDVEVRRIVRQVEIVRSTCDDCGAETTGTVPADRTFGYGPFLTALACHLTGMVPATRRAVLDIFRTVFDVPIELGTTQKLVDRGSEAIAPHYDAIEALVHQAPVNFIDETSQYLCHDLVWLWVMTNPTGAYYKVLPHRDGDSFRLLIKDWNGTLVSDDYRVYWAWDDKKAQRCVQHRIREAKHLAKHPDPIIADFGRKIRDELRRLCQMAQAPPTVGQWQAWLMRFSHLLRAHEDRRDDAGTFARALLRQKSSLWTFLVTPGVEPTNNRAERALRFAVIWRKRSLGAQSDKGCRWIERILSLRETCRLRGRNLFRELLDAITCYFEGRQPDLVWLAP